MGQDVLIFAVLTTGLVLIVNHLVRLVRNWTMHRTVREAISRDSGSLSELVGKIDEGTPAAVGSSDDRTGLVLIALAVALALYAAIVPEPEDMAEMMGLALFPGLVGLALFGRAVWLKKRGASA